MCAVKPRLLTLAEAIDGMKKAVLVSTDGYTMAGYVFVTVQ